MIKVNLLKDAGNKKKGIGSADSTVLDSELKTALGDAMGGNQALVKRVAFLIVPVILVFGYTWYVEYGLKSNIADLKKQVTTVDGQIAALKPEMDVIEQLKSEKNRLTTELNTVKGLSKKRYVYVKILDSLQSLIPEKAWITKMSVKDQTISIEGRATEDSVISAFMQSLEESAYFSNVTWVDSKEVNEPQGIVKAFNIRFNLENI